MRAFTKGIVRSVTGSLGRFLAILGIVALGCGFFAGLRMADPDMRAAADAWCDKSGLWDLRVVSTQGLEQADLDRLAALDGVAEVAGVTSVDAMAHVGTEQVAVRVTSLPEAYERGGEPALDRLDLRSGRWPSAPGECVASADNPALPVEPGDVVEVVREAGDGGLPATRKLTVTGTVSSSAYPYTVSFGSTSLGSGVIDQYLYVASGTFAEGTPYTEAHLSVEGAAAEESGSAAYSELVGKTDAALEDRADELAEARLDDVRADAQAKVDDARAAYEAERTRAEDELATSRAALDDAAAQIAEGERQLADAEGALAAGTDELARRRADAESQLADAQAQLDAARGQIGEQAAALDAQAGQVEAARAAYEAGLPVLLSSLAEQGLEAADAGSAAAALDAASAQVEAARAPLAEQVATLEAAGAAGALSPEDAAALEAARTQLAELDARAQALAQARVQAGELVSAQDAVAAYDAARARLADARAQADASGDELARRRADVESQLAAAQDELDASAGEVEASRARLADARAEHDAGLAAWEDSRAQADARLAEAAAEVDDAQAQVDALEPGELYVLDRTQSEGAATYQADSERMDTIATVFPFMFFLVAALVSLTTMTHGGGRARADRHLQGARLRHGARGGPLPRLRRRRLRRGGRARDSRALPGAARHRDRGVRYHLRRAPAAPAAAR